MFFSFSSIEQLAVPFSILIVYLALLLLARPDRDDERGDGLYAAYLGLVGVTALYALLVFGTTAIASAGELILVDRVGGGDQFNGGLSSPSGVIGVFGGLGSVDTDEQVTATLVLTASLTAAALIAFVYHARRRDELAISDGFAGSAAERVERSYRAAMAFVAVILGIIAAGFVGDAVYQLIAEPDAQGATREVLRDRAVVQLVAYGALLGVALAVFRASFGSIRGDDWGEDVDDGDDFDDDAALEME